MFCLQHWKHGIGDSIDAVSVIIIKEKEKKLAITEIAYEIGGSLQGSLRKEWKLRSAVLNVSHLFDCFVSM